MEEYNLKPCTDEVRVRDRVYGVRSSSSVSTMIGRVVAIDPSTGLFRIHFTEQTIFGSPAEVGEVKVRLPKTRYQWIDRAGLHHFEACPTR
jgi:hypothetical protein